MKGAIFFGAVARFDLMAYFKSGRNNEMEAPFKSLAVANRFIELSKNENQPLTLMKLLKIIYYAHGWHLALTNGKPLIDDTIEAWKFGPVAPSVYHAFKIYGANPISGFGTDFILEKGEIVRIQPVLETESFLDGFFKKIWEIYGKLPAFQLSAMTHQDGTPWHRVWYEMGGSTRKGMDIPDPLIKDYFKKRLAPQPTSTTLSQDPVVV